MSRHAGSKATGREWTLPEVQALRKLARQGTTAAAARALGRSLVSVRMKAMRLGISFRPVQPAALRLRMHKAQKEQRTWYEGGESKC